MATPGTTSNATLVRVTASASFTTASLVKGSPATSRTTTLPFLAAATAPLATSAGSPLTVVSSRSGCASRTTSSTAEETSGSASTVSAPAIAARARAVSSSGSPGPAPTKTTVPLPVPFCLRERVIACSCSCPRRGRYGWCGTLGGVRVGSPGRAGARRRRASSADRHQGGGATVEQLGGELPAQGLGLGGRSGDRVAD